MEDRIVAKRYELVSGYLSLDDHWLAQDIQSSDQDLVQIRLLRYPKHKDLYSIFETMAREVRGISHSRLVPLMDFGYDGHLAT